jgi:hypothetical protein
MAVEGKCSTKIASLTTRWSGPGIERQAQEEIEIPVARQGCEMVNPGRSARSRYALPLSLPSRNRE